MNVYFLVIVSLLGIVLFNEKIGNTIANKPRNNTMVFMVVILALVAGLRYNVGTDYYNYYSNYNFFKNSPLYMNDEPGIKIIARLSAIILDDPATMMFLAAVITVVLMATTVLKNSDMYWLSILLYVFLGCWHGCFNGVRQYLAAAILFAGHRFIKEEKLLQWCLIVFAASMCHITAVIGIFFYFYPKIKISIINLAVSVAIAFAGMNMYDSIFEFIGFLKSDTFDFVGEGAGYLTNSINPLRIAVAWVPVLFFLIFQKYYDKNDNKFHFYINMSILHAVLMTTAINSTYLGRVGIYTGVYNTIAWPLLLEKVEPRSRKSMIIAMLVLYLLYWRTEVSGATLVNFHWIFQR